MKAECLVTGLEVDRFGPPLHETPTVSVLMIAYNHERFVREAIESVFMQKTAFPVELVIGEDKSNDATRRVIEETCRHAPIPVRLLTSDRNVGMHANFRRTLAACRGRYFALLEGDDYWIDPQKLSLQIAKLEADPSLQLVAHRARLVFEPDVTPSYREAWPDAVIPTHQLGELTLRQLSFKFMIPTASVVTRRTLFTELPAWVDRLPFVDWYISLSAALAGRLVVLDLIGSVYRIHGKGVTATHFNDHAFAEGQIRLLRSLLPRASAHQRRDLLSALTSCVRGQADLEDSSGQTRWRPLMRLISLSLTHLRYGSVPDGKTVRSAARLLLRGTHAARSPS